MKALTSERVNKAFSFIQRWNGAPFQDRQGWRELLERVKGKQPSDISSIVETEYKERAILVDVFNFFEEMALAMNEGLADEATLRRFFLRYGGVVLQPVRRLGATARMA